MESETNIQPIPTAPFGIGMKINQLVQEQEMERVAPRVKAPIKEQMTAAEMRTMLLGLIMVAISIIMYFIVGTLVLRPIMNGQGSEEANCTVISAEISKWIDCAFECGPYCKGRSTYPCLQVYVNVTPWGRKVLLHRDEQSISSSSQCYFLPSCYRDQVDAHAVIDPLRSSFKALNHTPFRCFYNARVHQDDALLNRTAIDSKALLQWMMWPTAAMSCGAMLLALLCVSHRLEEHCDSYHAFHTSAVYPGNRRSKPQSGRRVMVSSISGGTVPIGIGSPVTKVMKLGSKAAGGAR
ncbi:calcium-activated potassium channel subunit beta-2-like [Lethenteron reissneri]|uniref:calcium-activated potassium channel subunit beta-2-like n=1 Tax=Lethenteron reissneri TaxID=7753 RepID=UPI002AB718FB|nr:calcium-activated potassium channel subunit beta-2-like [Lethenteron reissneri]